MRLLTLLVGLAVVPIGQTGATSVAGSWTAQFEGTTFVRLELSTTNGMVTGAINLGNFEVNDRGALRRVSSPPPGLKPISDITQRGSILTFSLVDGGDPDRFEFRLMKGGRAELQLLLTDADRADLAASGVPAPGPIILTKQ